MASLLDKDGILPFVFYAKTLHDMSEDDWQKLPPEAQIANIYADFGLLNDEATYYEFVFPTGNKVYAKKLEEAAQNLPAVLHKSLTGLVYTIPVHPHIDEILEYYC